MTHETSKPGGPAAGAPAAREPLAAPVELDAVQARAFALVVDEFVAVALDAGAHPDDALLQAYSAFQMWTIAAGLKAPDDYVARGPRERTVPPAFAGSSIKEDDMTGHPHDERFDDRADDQDLDRLRDAAAHVIDIVRTSVRAQLDAGIHPVDALSNGLAMLEQWDAAMDRASPMPPVTYTRHIEGILTRLQQRIGSERMWDWVREPHPACGPVRARCTRSSGTTCTQSPRSSTLCRRQRQTRLHPDGARPVLRRTGGLAKSKVRPLFPRFSLPPGTRDEVGLGRKQRRSDARSRSRRPSRRKVCRSCISPAQTHTRISGAAASPDATSCLWDEQQADIPRQAPAHRAANPSIP